MSEPTFESLMERLHEMPALIRRARRWSFWMGWLSATVGFYLAHVFGWLWA